MKRATSIILVLAICLFLCACGSGGTGGEDTAKSNEIELTLDNYEQYLDVSASAGTQLDFEGNADIVIGFDRSTGYDIINSGYSKNIYGYVRVEGLSQNFNYHNIKVEVEFKGKCLTCDTTLTRDDDMEASKQWQTYSFMASCDKVDITGCGRGETPYLIGSDRGIPYSYSGLCADFLEYEYTVISVSGSVSPA